MNVVLQSWNSCTPVSLFSPSNVFEETHKILLFEDPRGSLSDHGVVLKKRIRGKPVPSQNYSATLKVLQSRSDQDVFKLMGTYRTLSTIQAKPTSVEHTLMALVHLSQVVLHHQRERGIPVEIQRSWFIGYIGKTLLNWVHNQMASQIVCLTIYN